MPRSTAARPEPEPRPEPNSLIASAATLTRSDMRPKSSGALSWQTEAWSLYDEVGELRYAGNWMANALSRVDLRVERSTPDGPEAVEDGPAAEALDTLFGGETGRSQMMATFGVHLTVAGESYLVGITEDNVDEWLVCSTEELTGRGKRWTLERGDGQRRVLPDDALIIRIWRSHPRKWVEADSSVRAVLPVLRELVQLTKYVAATIDSRLAGAGVLLLPSEMTFPATPNMDPADPNADPFLTAFTDAMITPLEDRSNPASVVPIVLRAPAAAIAAAQHLSFSTPFDGQARDLREEAIRRLALGLDMPPEVLLGQSDSNHWSAWQIDEAALKVHVEPTCETICDALTRKYLWPVLDREPDQQDYYIVADTSTLRTRPNRSQEAIELFDRQELSGQAVRRETGFDESDAPSDREVTEMLTRKLASIGNETAMGLVGIKPAPTGRLLQVGQPRQAPPGQEPGQEQQQPVEPGPTPGLEQRPIPEQQVAAVLATSEVLALRALERARNRLGRRNGTPTPCLDDTKIDAALRGAWTQVPAIAPLVNADAAVLTARLDGYCRAILRHGLDHDRDTLRRLLLAEA